MTGSKAGSTTGSTKDARGRQALESLTELARQCVQSPAPGKIERGLQRLSGQLEEDQRRRMSWRWALVGAAATAAVALVVFSLVRVRATAELRYTVVGGSIVEGGYLRESGGTGVVLSFNEGTEFDLQSGTRARLRSVDRSGARIAIESGTASFRVTPAPQRHWLVDVGPFLVTVKGTVFSVSWNASVERFELDLTRGVVTVSGPISGGDITLHAGQHLVADLASGETRILEDKAPGKSPAQAASEPTGPTEQSARLVLPSERPAPRPPLPGDAHSDRRWAEPVAAGRWDQILGEAERAGVKHILETASSEDIFALADAARYRRRNTLARQALLAERRRFSASPRALDAAFFLGRVEESTDVRGALRWYEEYLSRAPDGAYAGEALGRKMILTTKSEGAARAQPIAGEYLRRFPDGSYAGAARALRRGP